MSPRPPVFWRHAIRAAYKASVRKKPSRKFLHRSSWNPTPTEFGDMINSKSGFKIDNDSVNANGNTGGKDGEGLNGGGLLSPSGFLDGKSMRIAPNCFVVRHNLDGLLPSICLL